MKSSVLSKIKKALPLGNVKYITFVVAGAVQSALSAVFALAVKNLINSVEYGANKTEILYSAITLVGVVVASFVLGVLVKLLGDNIVTQAECDLKNKIAKNYLGSSYKNSSKISGGDLITRFEGDLSTVVGVRINLIPNIVSTAVRLVGTVIALFILQPTFTLIILAVAVVIVACSFFIRKITYKLHKKSRQKNSEQNSYLSEVSNNLLAVKTFNAEDYTLKNFNEKFSNYKFARRSERYFLSSVSSLINFLFTSFYVTAAIFGAYSMYYGVNGVDFGVITALLQLVLQIKAPVSGISGFFTAYAEMIVAGERLFAIEGKKEERKVSISEFDKIVFDGVCFSYGNGNVLDGASFEINRGEKVLIKGASGEGKTTLVKLLSGLYPIDSGKITILSNGKDYNPSTVKDLISFVPQGNMIFSGTIKENVAYSKAYEKQAFDNAITLSGLSEVVKKYGENYYLGEGSALSEGQEQRVAIARAIYKNSPVIIMDEPTSALDSASELEFIKSLSNLKGVTLIIISHKPIISNFVDKVIELEKGKII